MQIFNIGAVAVVPLTNGHEESVSSVVVQVQGITADSGSMTPQRRIFMDGDNTTPPSWIDTTYINQATGAVVAAGTPITADGEYEFSANGSLIAMNVTTVTAGWQCFVKPLEGPSGMSSGSGGGGGGGAVTLAAGSVASGAYLSGAFASGAIRDGADVALGLTTSAAVTGDNDGSVNAHLRGLTKIETDVWDATNHRLYVISSDGTNYGKTMDAASRAGYQFITNGTQTMPTMDAIARKGFQQLTDGTTAVGVDVTSTGIKVAIAADLTAAPTTPLQVSNWDQTLTNQQTVLGASTAAQATDKPAVVALHPSSPLALATGAAVKVTNGTQFLPTMDVAARAGYTIQTDGTNTMPTGDVAARKIFMAVTDGTNTAAVKAASTAAVAADPATVVAISPNNVPVVAGTTTLVIPTFTVTASAYAAGNCMGGLMSLAAAMRVSGGTGVWSSLVLVDHGNQKPLLDVLVFKSSPAGTFTDHSAFPTMSTADNAKVVARISVVAADWVTIGGSAYATIKVNVAVGASGGALLYTAMNVTSGTPTPAATTDMGAVFTFLCD